MTRGSVISATNKARCSYSCGSHVDHVRFHTLSRSRPTHGPRTITSAERNVTASEMTLFGSYSRNSRRNSW